MIETIKIIPPRKEVVKVHLFTGTLNTLNIIQQKRLYNNNISKSIFIYFKSYYFRFDFHFWQSILVHFLVHLFQILKLLFYLHSYSSRLQSFGYHHLCTNIPAYAGNLRCRSVIFRYPRGAEFADIVLDPTDGYGSLLPERCGTTTYTVDDHIQRHHALSGDHYFLDGIAL